MSLEAYRIATIIDTLFRLDEDNMDCFNTC
jgi:hypothetical protein